MPINYIVEDDYYIVLDPDGNEIARGSKKDKRYVDIIEHGIPGEYRIIQPDIKVGLIAARDSIEVTPPNEPPEWVSVPSPSWTAGEGGTYDLNQNVVDPEGDTLTYSLSGASVALPTGVTLASNGVLTATSSLEVGATAGVLVNVSDGVNPAVTSPSITITGIDLSAGDSFPRKGAYTIGNWLPANIQSQWGTLAAKCQSIAAMDFAVIGGWRSWNYNYEVTKNFAELAPYIKSFNPNIKLLKYTNVVELDSTAGGENAFRRAKVEAETGPNGQTDWYLYNAANEHVSSFGSNWRVNHTSEVVADSNGYRYPEWSARYYFYNDGETAQDWNYTGSGLNVANGWDGVYEDVMDYSGKITADWNNNGVNEDKIDPDVIARVAAGHVAYHGAWDTLEPTFLHGGNYTIVCMNWNNLGFSSGGTNFSNRPLSYDDLLHSPFIEWWLGRKVISFEQWGGWEPCMRQMKNAVSIAKTPNYTMVEGVVGGSIAINSDATAMAAGYTGGVTPVTRTDEEWTRYMLCSALLDDVYFFCNDGSGLENELIYDMDEFHFDLGQAKAAPNYSSSSSSGYNSYSNGVYVREFDNGIAIVNPKNNGQKTITLPSAGTGFRWDRLGAADIGRTPADTTANSGATNITSVTIKDRDGLILKRTAT